jgi:putative membrane protein
MVSILGAFAALPVLHAGEPDPTGFLWSDWRLEPGVVLGVLVLVGGYLVWTGPRNRGRAGAGERAVSGGQRAAFLGGAATLLVALGPPLDDWADHYLLSAHMVQHLLLTMLAAPLLLLGTPGWLFEPVLRRPLLARAGAALTRPVVAFAIANATFILWHLPVFYEAALRSEALHVLEHQLFLLTALLAWWPVLGAVPAWPSLSLPLRCLYYAAQTIPGGIVGAFITLADPGLYQPYDTARRVFGIGLATDQELAGLLMWVVTSTIYLLLITVTFFRWAAREEASERAALAAAARPPAAGG